MVNMSICRSALNTFLFTMVMVIVMVNVDFYSASSQKSLMRNAPGHVAQ